jgi:hypothetical protein
MTFSVAPFFEKHQAFLTTLDTDILDRIDRQQICAGNGSREAATGYTACQSLRGSRPSLSLLKPIGRALLCQSAGSRSGEGERNLSWGTFLMKTAQAGRDQKSALLAARGFDDRSGDVSSSQRAKPHLETRLISG